jgi:hypothetical protein
MEVKLSCILKVFRDFVVKKITKDDKAIFWNASGMQKCCTYVRVRERKEINKMREIEKERER